VQILSASLLRVGTLLHLRFVKLHLQILLLHDLVLYGDVLLERNLSLLACQLLHFGRPLPNHELCSALYKTRLIRQPSHLKTWRIGQRWRACKSSVERENCLHHLHLPHTGVSHHNCNAAGIEFKRLQRGRGQAMGSLRRVKHDYVSCNLDLTHGFYLFIPLPYAQGLRRAKCKGRMVHQMPAIHLLCKLLHSNDIHLICTLLRVTDETTLRKRQHNLRSISIRPLVRLWRCSHVFNLIGSL